MRRRVLAAAAALACAVPLAPAPTAAAAPRSWVVAKAYAWGGYLALDLPIRVRHTGPGPMLAGFGISYRSPSYDIAYLFVGELRPGRTSLTTSRDAGTIDVTVEPVSARTIQFTAGIRFYNIFPGTIARVLVFFTDARIERVGKSVNGAYVYPFVIGSGARALRVAGAQTGGPGVAAGPAAAGVVRESFTSKAGILGAILPYCQTCTGTWRGPGGRSGTWRAEDSLVVFGDYRAEGDLVFLGAGGTWSFTWSGVAVPFAADPFADPLPAVYSPHAGDAPFGLYAPIGDHYKYFAAATS